MALSLSLRQQTAIVRPAPPDQPAPQPQPQPASSHDAALDTALITAILAVLGAGLGVQSTNMLLGRRLEQAGINPTVAAAAVQLAGRPARPPGRREYHGQAGKAQRQLEYRLRAAYLVNAARRLQKAWTAGKFKDGLAAERGFLAQHIDAARRRAVAVSKVDAAARALSPRSGGEADLLGWHLGVTGEHTTACLAAAGHNFDPAVRPRIGYPGTVHPRCGCWPGPPFPGATTVDEATAHLPRGAD